MTLRIAHRGHPYACRENTLPSFRSAIETGCDWLEVDVRTTADGIPVVLHDETLLRLWGMPARVSDVPLADVLRLGLADERIPTLADVLDLAAEAGVGVLVDSTNPRDALVAQALLADHGVSVPIQWCGDAGALAAVRGVDASAVVMYPYDGGEFEIAAPAALGSRIVNAEWSLYTPELIRRIHDAGMQAWAWTVNDAAEMRWLVDAGIDAITTDRLRLLGDALASADDSSPAPAAAPPAGIDLDRCLRVAESLAHWAVGYTRDAPLGRVEAKAHAADVVTAVDVAVETHVREVVAAELPGHVLVGEEQGGEPAPGAGTWYLDPVDGTTNLANRVPWTSMSLALAVDDQPLVAAVAHPWLDEVLLAARGRGTTRNGLPAPLPDSPGLHVMLTELAAHEPWPGMLDMLQRCVDAHVTMRVMGSGTLTLAGVAAGWGQAATVHDFNPIDHLAAVLLVREAGGRVLDESGRDVEFPERGRGVLVAAPGVADEAYRIWRGER